MTDKRHGEVPEAFVRVYDNLPSRTRLGISRLNLSHLEQIAHLWGGFIGEFYRAGVESERLKHAPMFDAPEPHDIHNEACGCFTYPPPLVVPYNVVFPDTPPTSTFTTSPPPELCGVCGKEATFYLHGFDPKVACHTFTPKVKS